MTYKVLTPMALARLFATHEDCPEDAIIRLTTSAPAGKDGWKTTDKHTTIFKRGKTLGGRRVWEPNLNFVDPWLIHTPLHINGVCDSCGLVFPAKASLEMAFYKNPRAGFAVFDKDDHSVYPIDEYGWGYICQECKVALGAFPSAPYEPLVQDTFPKVSVHLSEEGFVRASRTTTGYRVVMRAVLHASETPVVTIDYGGGAAFSYTVLQDGDSVSGQVELTPDGGMA